MSYLLRLTSGYNCTFKNKLQCMNCLKLKESHKCRNMNHDTRDCQKCSVYKKALAEFKTELLGTPSK